MELWFVVYASPAPQGSMKGIVVKGRAIVTSDNKKTMPYRHMVTMMARHKMAHENINEPMAAKHVPVKINLEFHLARTKSIPKKRTAPAVKPDLDKLVRATCDALKGVLYLDDGQVTELRARKVYADGPEMVVIGLETL
jgi:crossover junction endodeoxyribonuclease RusA